MQTEQMTRLLEKVEDDKSPSGYRIVGWKWELLYEDAINHVTGYDVYGYPKEEWAGKIVTLYSTDMETWVMIEEIQYEASELGIKVGDEWWFEGDIMVHKGSSLKDVWVLIYKENKWQIAIKGGQFVTPLTHLSGWKRIGNIHEEKSKTE